jgi:hypothetical protein
MRGRDVDDGFPRPPLVDWTELRDRAAGELWCEGLTERECEDIAWRIAALACLLWRLAARKAK